MFSFTMKKKDESINEQAEEAVREVCAEEFILVSGGGGDTDGPRMDVL